MGEVEHRNEGTMNKLLALLVLAPFLAGCVCASPAISKSDTGNLEINVFGPKNVPLYQADISVDGFFVGNATPNKPVLYLKRGECDVRVESPGYQPNTLSRVVRPLHPKELVAL